MERMSKEQILQAFGAFASELTPSSTPRKMVVAGGAAIVLLYGARETTKDVDVVLSDRTTLEAARDIASRLSLPTDWLNDGAKGYAHGLALGVCRT